MKPNWPDKKPVPAGYIYYKTDRERDVNNQAWNDAINACIKSYEQSVESQNIFTKTAESLPENHRPEWGIDERHII